MAQPTKKVASLKYADLLAQSSEEKSIEDRQYAVENAKLQLQSDTLATQRSLTNAKNERLTILRTVPLDFSELASKDSAIESLENGLERLNSYKDLF